MLNKTKTFLQDHKLKLKDNPRIYVVNRYLGNKRIARTVPLTKAEADKRIERFKRIYKNHYKYTITEDVTMSQIEDIK